MEVNTQALEFRKDLLKFAFQELTEPVKSQAFEYLKSKNGEIYKNTLISAIVAKLGTSKPEVIPEQTVVVSLRDQLDSLKENTCGTDYQHFLASNDDDFKTIFYLSRPTMNKLVRLVEKRATDLENSDLRYISPKKRVHITVWMMGNRESLATTAAMFGVSETEVSKIFLHTCKEIRQFAIKYIHWPSDQEREQITMSFLGTYGFPGVVGIIGHYRLDVSLPTNPPEEERFWNMEVETRGIVLQIVVDDKMLIRDTFVDASGETNAAKTFQTSPIHSWLLNNLSDPIIGTSEHLLGNSDLPQMTNVLTPFANESNGRPINDEEEEYNEIHMSVCSVVELTLERLRSCFQGLNFEEIANEDAATDLALAVCVLHNLAILYGETS